MNIIKKHDNKKEIGSSRLPRDEGDKVKTCEWISLQKMTTKGTRTINTITIQLLI